MENTRHKNYLEDSNPLDIIDRNAHKLSALNLLLTAENAGLELSDISNGLYFLLLDIEDQLRYASSRISERQRQHSVTP